MMLQKSFWEGKTTGPRSVLPKKHVPTTQHSQGPCNAHSSLRDEHSATANFPKVQEEIQHSLHFTQYASKQFLEGMEAPEQTSRWAPETPYRTGLKQEKWGVGQARARQCQLFHNPSDISESVTTVQLLGLTVWSPSMSYLSKRSLNCSR